MLWLRRGRHYTSVDVRMTAHVLMRQVASKERTTMATIQRNNDRTLFAEGVTAFPTAAKPLRATVAFDGQRPELDEFDSYRITMTIGEAKKLARELRKTIKFLEQARSEEIARQRAMNSVEPETIRCAPHGTDVTTTSCTLCATDRANEVRKREEQARTDWEVARAERAAGWDPNP